jgi:hypothetical protein
VAWMPGARSWGVGGCTKSARFPSLGRYRHPARSLSTHGALQYAGYLTFHGALFQFGYLGDRGTLPLQGCLA